MLTATEHRIAEFDTRVERFCDHLRENAARFFPELNAADVSVRLLHHARRHHSQLLKLEVSDGQIARKVIYKIPFCLERATRDEQPVEERPRLFSDIDPLTNGLREFRALESVQRHFTQKDDSRFGTIDMLDLLERPFVEVMACCPDRDLKSRLRTSTRWHANQAPRLSTVFQHAGAWLHEFHQLPDLEHTQTRHAHRDSFAEAVDRFTDGLIQKLGRKDFFQDIGWQLTNAAKNCLPEQIPSAVVHGDFAPRNILVNDNSRVTVFDMQRRWRAPVYEDLAYFLMSVKTPGPQVRSQGMVFSKQQLLTWEADFLAGYFGSDVVQTNAVRLYEILLTLEWWAAINFRQTSGSLTQRATLFLSNRYLFRYLPHLLKDLN